MAVKFSRAVLAASTKAMLEVVAPADRAKLLLENANGTMFYLVVGDKVVCWSENRDEIIAASEGRFQIPIGTEALAVPNVRVEFPFISKPTEKPDLHSFTVGLLDLGGQLSSLNERANRRLAEAQRYRQRFIGRSGRIMQTLDHMLRFSEYRTSRVADLKALNKKLGLAKMQEATTTDQLDAYGALIGSWKLKEKAGIA